MGINTTIPFKTCIFNLIAGSLFFLFGSSALSIMINKYLKEWKTYWAVFLVLIFLVLFGYFKLRQGAKEWNEMEELEFNRMKLENKKLELEIKLLEKSVKNKK